MDVEKLYNKLDKIDEKLDVHMLKVEKRVSTLEEQYRSVRGYMRIAFSLIVSVITGIMAWVGRQFFS